MGSISSINSVRGETVPSVIALHKFIPSKGHAPLESIYRQEVPFLDVVPQLSFFALPTEPPAREMIVGYQSTACIKTELSKPTIKGVRRHRYKEWLMKSYLEFVRKAR